MLCLCLCTVPVAGSVWGGRCLPPVPGAAGGELWTGRGWRRRAPVAPQGGSKVEGPAGMVLSTFTLGFLLGSGRNYKVSMTAPQTQNRYHQWTRHFELV